MHDRGPHIARRSTNNLLSSPQLW